MKRCLLVLLAICLLSMDAPMLAHATDADLIGRRFECLYRIENGEKVFIQDSGSRPYVEFIDQTKCDYQDAYDASYILNGDKLAVLEGEIGRAHV